MLKVLYKDRRIRGSYDDGLCMTKLALLKDGNWEAMHPIFLCKDLFTAMHMAEEVGYFEEDIYGFEWSEDDKYFNQSRLNVNYLYLCSIKNDSEVKINFDISKFQENLQNFFDLVEDKIVKHTKLETRTEVRKEGKGLLIKYPYFWHTNHYYFSLFIVFTRIGILYEKGKSLKELIFSFNKLKKESKYYDIFKDRESTLPSKHKYIKAFLEGKYFPKFDYSKLTPEDIEDYVDEGFMSLHNKDYTLSSEELLELYTKNYI